MTTSKTQQKQIAAFQKTLREAEAVLPTLKAGTLAQYTTLRVITACRKSLAGAA